MKKSQFDSKINLTIIVSIFFLLILGCQPEGGELLPIGGNGVEIATSRFENDTAVINDNGLRIKFYGTWSGESFVQLRVAVDNELDKLCQVNFEQAILKDGNNQIAKISSINEKPDFKNLYSSDASNRFPIISFSAKEKKAFLLTFATLINIPSANEQTSVFNFSLPVKVGNETKEYKIQFKAVEKKVGSGKSDPEDW